MIKEIILDAAFDFDPAAHTELRMQQNRKRSVSVVAGNLVGNVRTEDTGVCARVYKNGVYGFASSGDCDINAVKEVLNAATENARFMDRHVAKSRAGLPLLGDTNVLLDREINDIEQKKYIDFVMELDDYISRKYPSLSSRIVRAYADSMEKVVRVSNGCNNSHVTPRSYIYLSLAGETGSGMSVEVMEPYGSYGTFDENFKAPEDLYERIDEQYRMLMQKQEGVFPDAGVKTCILGSDITGILAHEAVGHTTEADLVLGGSVAGPMLNKPVASELITLVDFAHTALGKPAPLPVYADDEGTKAEDAIIIEKGMLKGYMNSRETAQHFGVKPQGNARAYLYSDEPLIRMRNTAILPGSSSIEEMIASVDDGYYMTRTSNGQADTTGEFMFGISMGYEIKKGKIGKAILDTTITGVAFDMLKTVDMVSDRMGWESSGFCGKKQPMPVGLGGPDIKCKITVGGR